MSRGDDGCARAAASAMSVNALRAATTSCGGFERGHVLARMAGTTPAAWTGARKAGPPKVLCQPVQSVRARGMLTVGEAGDEL